MSGIRLNDILVFGSKKFRLWNRFLFFFYILKGDSGGPLYYFDRTIGRNRLLGVTQSGVYCGDVGYYEFVPPRMNWIMKNIRTACLYN